jgi:hypothetical protein
MNKTVLSLCEKLDIGDLPPNPFIFVVGSRRSGKSVLTSELIRDHFDADFRIAMCGHHSAAQNYVRQGLIPADYAHGHYKPSMLQEFFAKCDKIMKSGKKLPSTLLVLDDVLRTRGGKKGYTTSKDWALEKLAVCGRHYRCTVILIVQSISIALNFARNADLVLISPSSLFCGTDYKTLTENFMSADQRKANRELLSYYKKYDFLALRYYLASREPGKLLAYYRSKGL